LATSAYGLGYPSLTGDKAALVVLAPPDKPGGKFRILYSNSCTAWISGPAAASSGSATPTASKNDH
jgi:hypothetical protein